MTLVGVADQRRRLAVWVTRPTGPSPWMVRESDGAICILFISLPTLNHRRAAQRAIDLEPLVAELRMAARRRAA